MTATDRALDLARAAAAAADDKLATTITGIDVSEQLALTDVFVIVSAESERQVGAIVDEVEDVLRELGTKPMRREGEREGRWVLIDFGDIVVHVQHDEERDFYELERLWKDCPTIDLGVVGTEQGGGEPDRPRGGAPPRHRAPARRDRPQRRRASGRATSTPRCPSCGHRAGRMPRAGDRGPRTRPQSSPPT